MVNHIPVHLKLLIPDLVLYGILGGVNLAGISKCMD